MPKASTKRAITTKQLKQNEQTAINLMDRLYTDMLIGRNWAIKYRNRAEERDDARQFHNAISTLTRAIAYHDRKMTAAKVVFNVRLINKDYDCSAFDEKIRELEGAKLALSKLIDETKKLEKQFAERTAKKSPRMETQKIADHSVNTHTSPKYDPALNEYADKFMLAELDPATGHVIEPAEHEDNMFNGSESPDAGLTPRSGSEEEETLEEHDASDDAAVKTVAEATHPIVSAEVTPPSAPVVEIPVTADASTQQQPAVTDTSAPQSSAKQASETSDDATPQPTGVKPRARKSTATVAHKTAAQQTPGTDAVSKQSTAVAPSVQIVAAKQPAATVPAPVTVPKEITVVSAKTPAPMQPISATPAAPSVQQPTPTNATVAIATPKDSGTASQQTSDVSTPMTTPTAILSTDQTAAPIAAAQQEKQTKEAEIVAAYTDALDQIKTLKPAKPQSQENAAAIAEVEKQFARFLAQIEHLANDKKATLQSRQELTEALNRTYYRLTHPNDKEAQKSYEQYAKTMQGQSNVGLQVLGGIMLALGLATFILGMAFFPVVVGVAATVVGVAAAAAVSGVTIGLTTAGFFAGGAASLYAGTRKGLSETMGDLDKKVAEHPEVEFVATPSA